MATIVLKCGGLVFVDDEDLEFAAERCWHVYLMRPAKQRPCAVRQEQRYLRTFRVFLHREIALRMHPELENRRFRVFAANANFLDCRRENLIVRPQKARRGRKAINYRPEGWCRHPGKVYQPGPRPEGAGSALWTGGVQYAKIDRRYEGGGHRVRKLISGRPID